MIKFLLLLVDLIKHRAINVVCFDKFPTGNLGIAPQETHIHPGFCDNLSQALYLLVTRRTDYRNCVIVSLSLLKTHVMTCDLPLSPRLLKVHEANGLV